MRTKKLFIVFAIIVLSICLHSPASASTNIVSSPSTARWAWNNIIGWLDFYVTGNVTVTSQDLQGYASSSVGWISLDCAHSPAGNICGTTFYKVTNDGAGALAGWAWNDSIGWISFCGRPEGGAGCETNPNATYEVVINQNTGDFSGWAWNDAVGWISFNCVDIGVCGPAPYKVQTIWVATSSSGYLDSSTFDTGVSGGAQINSISWQGSPASPSSGSWVGFQLAVSNDPAGPWEYEGPDGTADTYYVTDPGTPHKVDYAFHNNARYFRYRVTLVSNETQTSSPQVNSVSVNWSR